MAIFRQRPLPGTGSAIPERQLPFSFQQKNKIAAAVNRPGDIAKPV
jgi:hypothetical protein